MPAPQTPFGRIAVAMVTPFRPDGTLDPDGAQRLAAHLVNEGCDGLVISGTTGESPTTTDAEKTILLQAVLEAVGDRCAVTAGIGTSDTARTRELAQAAERSGAHGLLVVTPYYSRPTQQGVAAHLTAVADATSLPVLLYDVPARTGTALSRETLLRLAEHPRISGVKDAAYDFRKSAAVLAATDLAYYSGADELNLPLAAIGAGGVVSTVGNIALQAVQAVLDAHAAGEPGEAARRHQRLMPLIDAMMGGDAPGTVTAKALLRHQGLPSGPVRLPLADAGEPLIASLVAAVESATTAAAASFAAAAG